MPIQINELIIRADLSDRTRETDTGKQHPSSDYPARKAAYEEDINCLDKYLNDRRER